MYKKDSGLIGAIFFIVFWITIVIGGIWGYILNIIGLLNHGSVDILGQTILGAIGIFVFPIGVIMGYFIW